MFKRDNLIKFIVNHIGAVNFVVQLYIFWLRVELKTHTRFSFDAVWYSR